MNNDKDKALVPIEQKEVGFYGDAITAVLVDDGQVYVPIRPICDFIGVNWSAQRQRINRDPVLSAETKTCVVVTTTQGQPDQRREMISLPLEYIPGWLFGISANRVKDKLRPTIIRYQRECFRVLWEAFQTGRLTTDQDLMKGNSPAVQAYHMAMAIADLARSQVVMERRIDTHEQRIEQLETTIGDPGRYVTPEQASQISQAVKAVAIVLTKQSGSNQFGGVYGELYRKFGITGYKLLPSKRFQEAMGFLTEWHQSLVGEEPF